jgi:NAD(P)-dependent dehydrogenase (short-subunit alcohol dehydrogenase family)
MDKLAGKIAIITGAGTGLGPIMAKLFVSEGAKVVLAARRLELLEAVAHDIGADAALAVRADVTVEADVAHMVDAALKRFGQVDVMVNNAAVPGTDKYIWEQTLENWNAVIGVDVTAAMLCSREVLKRSMLERRSGSIINFSSTASFKPFERKSHYVTAKAAVRAFTKVVAAEAGPYGIRCNCLVPGLINTELFQNWVKRIAGEKGISPEEQSAQLSTATSLRTVSQPSDIAKTALFLACDDSRTITGQSIVVDAGEVMLG